MDHAPPNPVVYAVPLFLITILLEAWWVQRKRKKGAPYKGHTLKDSLASIAMGLGYLAISGAWIGGIYVVSSTLYANRIFDFQMTPWTYLALFFAEDFVYYWFHRLSHESRIWWASHVNHHSSTRYNLTTAVRQPWTSNFTLTWLLWSSLSFLGFPPDWVFFQAGVNLLYQYWIHTEVIQKMPSWFEFIFNTPSHHRVHHSKNIRYLDRNYAGIFIIWDRLFGTFEPESSKDPCVYGLTYDIQTYNPARIAFHEWGSIFQDLKKYPVKTWFRYLFASPGWSHDGSRKTSAQLKSMNE